MRKNFKFIVMVAVAVILFAGNYQQAEAVDSTNEMSSARIMKLVESLYDDGQIENESSARALKMHLTAVNHYEQQGESDKVIEHMSSFKLLLDHHLNMSWISEQGHHDLMDHTDALLDKWDVLHIVQDGQANAVIVTTGDHLDSVNIPGWSTWNASNSNGFPELSTEHAYFGNASVALQNMRDGALLQSFTAQTGSFEFKTHYLFPDEGDGRFTLRVALRDAQNRQLGSVSAEFVSAARHAGEWRTLTLQGEIPESLNNIKIERIQPMIHVVDQQDTILYLDEVSFSYVDENENMLRNPSFEELTYSGPVEALVGYIQKSTGAELPVVTIGGLEREEGMFADFVRLYVGAEIAPEDPHIEEKLAQLNHHGFIILPYENHITIAGSSSLGTEFGVYEFLERYVGIRWLMPGPYGTDIPQTTDLTVPRKTILDQPTFPFRQFDHTVRNMAERAEWARYNRVHREVDFGHNLYNLLPPGTYKETNPEWYPEDADLSSDRRWQPCFTAPGIVEESIRNINAYFDANPEAISYSISVNDSGGFCGHEKSGKVNSIGRDDMSDVYYEWVKQVAEGVQAVHPEKYLGAYAYSEVYDPPTNMTLPANVIVNITDERLTWIDPQMRVEGQTLTDQWSQVATLAFYEYLYGSAYLVPRTYYGEMAEIYRYADEAGVISHSAELYPNFGEGPKPWLSARLQWNPHQDVNELLTEWYTRAVGEDAAPYLQQYYEIWEDFWQNRMFLTDWYLDWANSDRRSNYLPLFDRPNYLLEVTNQDMIESRHLLETVVEKASTNEQLQRAEALLKAFEYYEASVFSYPRNEEIEDPTNEQEAVQLLDDIKRSLEMNAKRLALLNEYDRDPVLHIQLQPPRYGGHWDGVQRHYYEVLNRYVETEPDGGRVGQLVNDFLSSLPEEIRRQFIGEYTDPSELHAHAYKTDAIEDEIMQTLDFSQGPWTDAEPFNEFFVMNTTEIPPVETKVYLLWDETNLYVGYENFDHEISQMVASDSAPGFWWSDGSNDSVETYVTDDLNGKYKGFFTNPKEVHFVYEMQPGTGFGPVTGIEWETVTHIGDDRWNVIQKIPFSSIDVNPSETDTLMGYFFRPYPNGSINIGWGGGTTWNTNDFKPIYLVEK